MIAIENLFDYPEYIDTVVNWLYSEWGDNNFQFWNSHDFIFIIYFFKKIQNKRKCFFRIQENLRYYT